MYPPIFSVCAASAQVKALIGTNPIRLFPFGEAPQSTVYPYAVWQIISGSPENYLGNLPDIDGYVTQVDVYANSADSARNVAQALRDAIEGKAHIVRWMGEGRDPETKAYRIGFDVSWLTSR